MSDADPDIDLKHDPEYWKEKFKGKSNSEIDAEIGLLKMMFEFAPDKCPEYTAILKALDDNDPYQAEKREQERLSELKRARAREWDKVSGFTVCMNRVIAEAKANGTHTTTIDIIRECGFAPLDKFDNDEDWQEEMDRLRQRE